MMWPNYELRGITWFQHFINHLLKYIFTKWGAYRMRIVYSLWVRWVRWGKSVSHVSVMLTVSWCWLVSPPPGNDEIFTECVGRMEWDQRVARRPGSYISHACAGPSVFLTCDVFGGVYESPNIFLTDFLSAAFSKLCVWFILSWMKRSFHCEHRHIEKAKMSFRQKH